MTVDDRLMDFSYPGEDQPVGVVARTIDRDVLAVIDRLAPMVRQALDLVPERRWDCRYTCSAWRGQLDELGVEVREEGGVGEDDEAFTADRRFIPLDERSGYRESDGRIHRHWWLRVGSGHWLFDPTAHTFEDRGGVETARYVVDGRNLRL